jgi:hypothetical protein
LVGVERRLKFVEAGALGMHSPGATNWRDWHTVKRAMEELVGWRADNPKLANTEAYTVALTHLLDCFETGRRPTDD